ncbi:glycosyltransferase family 4 protein [Flavobacterium fluviale]|uniref:Glycosyltransferase family 1 protein n=1 Tax=Flavobacterium fluviale TaxID=2249356 RepID=A0A344LN84_9FLAO|nr:glycosyltransferase family 1 protein [Flavobacterium fluviale]AXB55376.1 glycosyltransferase family 1 protein [Flavobacterium fluviale]
MNLLLDNIIFSLQRAGGASVVWQQHLERLLKDDSFKCKFLEYDNAVDNFFRKNLSLKNDTVNILDSKYLFLKRYINLYSKAKDEHIFHSSHYRVEKAKNVINITTVHDFTYEYFVKGLARKVHSFQKNLAINSSDGIICISESTKKDLLRFLPHIKQEKIKVIYNGVDKTFRVLEDNEILEKKHPFEDYNYLLYVGDRKSIHKNFRMVVEASALSKIPLLLVGGGQLTEEENQILKKKIGLANFKWLTGVSVEHLNYYYNKAYCLLYPSLYEGFGIPVIEAQRAGCPVVSTDCSSIPEVIGNIYLAVKEPTAQKITNKILELSINSSLRKESVDMGFEKSKNFSWDKTYKETTNFYKELYFEK